MYSFLPLSCILLCGCTSLFIHSPINGHELFSVFGYCNKTTGCELSCIGLCVEIDLYFLCINSMESGWIIPRYVLSLKPPKCVQKWLYHFISPPTEQSSSCSTPLAILGIVSLLKGTKSIHDNDICGK